MLFVVSRCCCCYSVLYGFSFYYANAPVSLRFANKSVQFESSVILFN